MKEDCLLSLTLQPQHPQSQSQLTTFLIFMALLAALCTISSSLWLLSLLLVSLILVLLNRRGPKRLVRHPPGPLMLQTVTCFFRVHFSGIPHFFLWQFSKKYGPIMLLNIGYLPTLVISSAEMAKEVLRTEDPNFCSRPPLVCFKRLSHDFIDVALGPYSEYWREMRKMYVLKLLSIKSVQSFRHVREAEVSILINSIISSHQNSSSSSTKIIVNLDEKLRLLMVSIVFRVLFGVRYEGKITCGGCKFEDVVSESLETLGSLSSADFVPYIGWIIDIITHQHSRLEKNFHDLDAFLEYFISEYLGPNRAKSNDNTVDVLFGLEGEQIGGSIFTRQHVKAVLLDLFVPSIDTTSASMVWAMAELMKNPGIMKKVQHEIRSCAAKKGKVEESDLDQLQYLKMVVKETLRLHPPTPLLIPRECIKQCKIKDYDIFPKTMVLINAWAIGRDPKSWENPDVFFPERFTDNSIDFKGQHFDFLPFGAGRRGCPAIFMSNVVMELTLANLLLCFNWELTACMKEVDLDMEEAGTFTLRKKSGLQLVAITYDRH